MSNTEDLRAFIWTFYYEDGEKEKVIDPPMTLPEARKYMKKQKENGRLVRRAWPQFYGDYKSTLEADHD